MPAQLTVEQRDHDRFVVLFNGNVLVECRSQADVDDFLQQWQQQTPAGRYRVEAKAVRIEQPSQKTTASQLLLEDPLAAEVYLVQAVEALKRAHGWTDAEIEHLCHYAVTADKAAIAARHNLPPQQSIAARKRHRIFGIFG